MQKTKRGRPHGTKKNNWKHLNERQLQEFLKAVRKGKTLRDDVMMSLTLYLGLRAKELVNIKLRDIEAESREVTIRGVKSGRKRSYPEIYEGLWKKLDRWIGSLKGNETYLFPSPKVKGQPISTQAVKNLFKKYAKEAGLPLDFSIHSLRHTCAMLKAKANESPIKIMLWLRHRSVTSTQRYFEQIQFERDVETTNHVFRSYL